MEGFLLHVTRASFINLAFTPADLNLSISFYANLRRNAKMN